MRERVVRDNVVAKQAQIMRTRDNTNSSSLEVTEWAADTVGPRVKGLKVGRVENAHKKLGYVDQGIGFDGLKNVETVLCFPEKFPGIPNVLCSN